MTIEQHSGTFSADVGQDAEVASPVITLRYDDPNNPARGLLVGIAPELGSNFFRFRVGEHDIIHYDAELVKQKAYTGNFVLWPFPNRITDRRYTYQGQAYSLADRDGPGGNYSLIHGLVFDRAWGYEQPVVGKDSVSVTTFVEMGPDSPYFHGYPFESRLSLTYTLSQTGVSITYRVENQGSKDLPFGFALHPYFALLSGKDETLVSIPARTVMESDTELLPTGRLLNADSLMYSMFDLRTAVPVGQLKLDHVYTDLTPQAAATIEYRSLGMQLQVTATDDFTHAVIYTPPAPFNNDFFCLEHQTCSTDAVNFHNQGEERQRMAHLLEVHPGESYSGSLHYTLTFA